MTKLTINPDFFYKRNPAIKEYTLKKGNKRYLFHIYTGINPYTGEKSSTTRRSFKTPAIANAEYRKIEAQVKNGQYVFEKPVDTVGHTYGDIYDLWIEKRYRKTVKSSTLYKTKQIFKRHILPELADKNIEEITPAMMQSLVDKWNDVYTKYNLVVRYAARVFKYAMLDPTLHLIDSNPLDFVLMPAKAASDDPDMEDDNFFTSAELDRFIDYILKNTSQDDSKKIDFDQATFFITLAFTGLRKGELVALTWNDVDLDNKIIDVNKTVVTKEDGKYGLQPPKWDSYRKITFNELVLSMLKRQRENVGDSTLVFPSSTNKWYSLGRPNIWLDRIIELGNADYDAAYKLTGNEEFNTFVPRITPHGLRHTHATWLFEHNPKILPKTVQERLGHKNIDVTLNIYTHVTHDQKDIVADTLDVDYDFNQNHEPTDTTDI